MKRLFILLVFLGVFSVQSYSQTGCDRVMTTGSGQNDYFYKINTDNLGNILLALSFKDTLIFGTDTAFSTSNYDGLIVKLGPSGNLLWAQQIAGIGNAHIRSVATDASNNIYIAGAFDGTAYFGTSINHTSQGAEDMFVAKINASGSWQWVKTGGNALSQTALDIKATVWGDVAISGTFAGKIYYNNDSLTSAGLNDGFVALLNASNGDWRWAKAISGTSDISVLSMDVHPNGSLVLGGVFNASAAFGITNLNASGGSDGFITLIDSTGAWQWAVKAGGTSNDSVLTVKFIPSGKIFAAGSFCSIGQFGTNLLNSSGGSDIFIGLLNAAGICQWALRAGGSGNDIASALSIDANGFAVITGEFEGLSSFGVTNLVSAGGKDIFISRIDSTGAWLWTYRQGGSGNEHALSISVSPNHSIHLAGNYTGNLIVKTSSFPSKGGSDLFLLTVDRNMFGYGRPFVVSATNTIMCGDTLTLTTSPADNYLTYTWTPSAVISNPNAASVQVFPASTGYIKSTAALSGCSISDSVLITVSPLPLLAGNAQTMNCGGIVQLNASLSSPVSGVTYSWAPAASLSNTSITNPFATPSLTTTFTVTATKGLCQSLASTVVQVNALPVDSICMVTVDDTLNKNLVIFEKRTMGPIAFYKIYRETFVANVYDSIGIVHPDSAGFFVDILSNPAVKAERYKISIVDSCGFESTLSPEHKTMHLSINLGTGATWNLLWSPYVGFSVPTYRIWRGATLNNLVLIDSVPGTSVSYTDLTPPAGGLYYMVEIISPNTCYPYFNTKAATSYNSSRSNQADNGLIQPVVVNALFSANPLSGNAPLIVSFTDNSTGSPSNWEWYFGDGITSNLQNPTHTYTTPGLFTVKLVAWNQTDIDSISEVDFIMVSNSIDEYNLNAAFKVFPNPLNNEALNLVSGLMPIQNLHISDISGRLVLMLDQINAKEYSLPIPELSKGIYLLRVRLENGSVLNRKLLIE